MSIEAHIRQSVHEGPLSQNVIARSLRLNCATLSMCSACKVIHVRLLTRHSYYEWAPQSGDMAGVQSLACQQHPFTPCPVSTKMFHHPRHNDTLVIQDHQVACLSSHTLALPHEAQVTVSKSACHGCLARWVHRRVKLHQVGVALAQRSSCKGLKQSFALQGIYLCEHRDRASSRRIVVTCHGDASR